MTATKMFEKADFSIQYKWGDDGDVMRISHFNLVDEHRGHGRASAILETLVRVAYYEGANAVEISMGGGEEAEEFLTRNGFFIMRQREYQHDHEHIEGDYGVDAVRSVS